MRFCPFCAHENADDATQCGRCGKRLPTRPAARAGRDGEVRGVPSRPPSAVTPKPNLPSRPGGLHPKSPLRARVAARVDKSASGNAPTVEAPALPEPPVPPPVRPPSRTGSQPVVPPPPPPVPPPPLLRPPVARKGSQPALSAAEPPPLGERRSNVQPLPPPPGDYRAPMHTPTAVREATGSAPTMPAPGDDSSGQFDPAHHALQTVPSDGPSDSLTLRQAQLTPFDRVRTLVTGGWRTLRRGFDVRAVRYVISTARATVKKKGEIARLRRLNVAEQQKLDAVLAELGRQARAANLGVPALADEMRATKALETEREAARSRIAGLEKQRLTVEERNQSQEIERQTAIARADEAVAELSQRLAEKTTERAGHRTALNRLDSQLKSLSRQVQTRDAAAIKATDPAQQGILRGEVEALRAQVAALEPELEKFSGKAADLDRPVAELEANLAAAKERTSQLRRELGEAARAHQAAIAQIAAEVDAETRRIAQSERELSLKFVTLGTLLNLNRVQGGIFDPLYREFDELKQVSSERDIEVGRLEAEIQGYDRKLFQKGVVVLAVGVTVLVALMVIFI